MRSTAEGAAAATAITGETSISSAPLRQGPRQHHLPPPPRSRQLLQRRPRRSRLGRCAILRSVYSIRSAAEGAAAATAMTGETSISSAPSLTRSSAASSPSSPPRTAPAHRLSLAGGFSYGALRHLISWFILKRARSASSSPRSRRSSLSTLALPAAIVPVVHPCHGARLGAQD
jgi:hypothetical protein